MNERDAFVRGIAANLYDDAPRLAFADYLDEHGEHDRAEFIRVQCELEPIRDKYELPRAVELHAREDALLRAHEKTWLGAMPVDWGWRLGSSLDFRRGFPDTLALPARTFLRVGGDIRELHPTIRRVVLFRVNGYGERVAACATLAGLAELELACWYGYDDAQAIARSKHLDRLQVLVFWLGSAGYGLPDVRKCRVIAATKAWPNLRELTLLNPYDENERSRKKLVGTANKAAGRDVAVYRVGYPKLFPFAADFEYAFPGHLPDGRAALAAEDHTASPPTLCVLTFDKNGKQTKDVIRVPFPPDLLALKDYDWWRHTERQRQHLREAIGLEPGFIRIQDCHFPGDDHYKRPFPDRIEEFGRRDTDEDEFADTFPEGHGGRTWRYLRDGEWVFGWDRYGDKRGRIHST